MQFNNVKYRVGIIASCFFIFCLLQVTTSIAQKTNTGKTLTKSLQIKSGVNQSINPSLKPDSSKNDITLEEDTII